MSEWKEAPIGEIAETFAGGTPSRARLEYFSGNIPWVSSSEVNQPYIINTKEKITQDGLENSSAKWIPKNSVLIAMYGATAGQVSQLRIDATSNQAVLALLPKKGIFNEVFLYYKIKENKEAILFLAQGSGQPNLSKDIIDNFKIKYPPLPEQRRIARILSTCDGVIEKTKAAVAKYQAIKQGLLHDLFTRGIDPATRQLRPTQAEAPERYRESALGWIPREWEVRRLEEVTESYSGGTPSRSREDYFKGNIPWISSSEVNQDSISFTKEKITQEAVENSSARWVKKGAILIALYGATAGQISKLLIDATTNQVVLSCLSSDSINSNLLYYILIYNKEKLLFKAQGSGQPNLSKQIVDSLAIPLMEVEEQTEIAKRLISIDQKLQTEQNYLAKLEAIKAGLMEDLLTGRVSESEFTEL